jgi:hypothetical protein
MSKRNAIILQYLHILLVFFLILLGGCKETNQPKPPAKSHTIFFQMGKLDIYSYAGFQCSAYTQILRQDNTFIHNNNFGDHIDLAVDESSTLPHGNLVLATNRLSYDTEEIQQMSEYSLHYIAKESLGSLPSTLRWVSGGPLCTLDLQVTNTEKKTITIQTQQLRLLHTPQKNTNEYRLVDFCALSPYKGACPGAAGGAEEKISFSLGNASTPAGTLFTPALHTENQADGQLPLIKSGSAPVVIPARSIVYLHFEIVAGASLDDAYHTAQKSYDLIYDVVPEFVLSTDHGPQVVSLTPLTKNLFFTSSNHTRCYTLHANTFVYAAGPHFGGIFCI